MDDRLRQLLAAIFSRAVAAVNPVELVKKQLPAIALDSRPVHIVALGKAANGMALGAIDALTSAGREPRSGAVVSSIPWPGSLPPRFLHQVGDHPIPGAGSLQAAKMLGEWAASITSGDQVIALLSGGTSSLIGAPREGLSQLGYQATMARLLHAGLPIGKLNSLRRKISRWADGRLGAALQDARITLLAISDVPGDRLDDIGSSPFSQPTDSGDRAELKLLGIPSLNELPDQVRKVLAKFECQPLVSHKGPVTAVVIGSNTVAARAAVQEAHSLGLSPDPVVGNLTGPADLMGRDIADWIRNPRSDAGYNCRIYGGETTVKVSDGAPGIGGRCQELALAAGEILAECSPGCGLLAAGTDGRDGATPAAGGFADPSLWPRLREAGRDPSCDLACHDSYSALKASGDLYFSGSTGTNAMDLVIAVTATETIPPAVSNPGR